MKYILLCLFMLSCMVSSSQADSLYTASETNNIASEADNQVELGMVFQASEVGDVTHIKFFKPVANDAAIYTVNLWSFAGQRLATKTYSAPGISGWQRVALDAPVKIEKNINYVVSFHCKGGRYISSVRHFSTARVRGKLTAPASSTVSGNGRYSYGTTSLFPTRNYNQSTYFVDVVFRSEPELPPQPLIVNAGRDTLIKYPQDSIRLSGTVSGDGVTYKWTEINDSTWSSTELRPLIRDMRLQYYEFNLTATDRYGVTAKSTVIVKVAQPVMIILSDGTWIMPGNIIVDPIIIELPYEN